MLELKLTGVDEINQLIAKLPQAVSKNAAFESLVVCTQPVVDAMRQEAPMDKGSLKESIGFRLRRYRGGKFLLVAIGPRRGQYGPEKDQPSKVVHLIENGHWAGKGANRKWVNPNAFMRRAWMATKDRALALFRERFGDRLMVEVAKRAARRKKK